MDAASGAVYDFDVADALSFETGFECVGERLGCERDGLRTPTDALGEGDLDVGACGEGDDLVAVGEGFADGEGAMADRAGRAEDR